MQQDTLPATDAAPTDATPASTTPPPAPAATQNQPAATAQPSEPQPSPSEPSASSQTDIDRRIAMAEQRGYMRALGIRMPDDNPSPGAHSLLSHMDTRSFWDAPTVL